MTKAEIAQFLIDTSYGKGNPAIEAAIAYVAKKNPAGPAATRTQATADVAAQAVVA
jgi:hypothetical protein